MMDNDTRGWIMTCLSGIACIFGASIIGVDCIVRLFPGKKNFSIQHSNGFLSCSLSLSAGVMLFSALYNMLPSSKRSFQDAGFSPKAAAWTLVGCFLGGVFGIQILSQILHHFIPSHVVGCEHTHGDDGLETEAPDPELGHRHGRHSHHHSDHLRKDVEDKYLTGHTHSETTPLLPSSAPEAETRDTLPSLKTMGRVSPLELGAWGRRQQLNLRLPSGIQELLSGTQVMCDANGNCFGYSDPCGQECFKNINSRGGARIPLPSAAQRTLLTRSATSPHSIPRPMTLPEIEEETTRPSSNEEHNPDGQPHRHSIPAKSCCKPDASEASSSTSSPEADASGPQLVPTTTETSTAAGKPHHHHVPANAFLSIGLQTSIAIALHKLPEGFITYATNHANPHLGLAIFLALFIHNITEGFVLALPLFLALNSRWSAFAVSTVLGGLSQPVGAAVAAAWLAVAERRRSDGNVSDGVYAVMFAVTSGIMAAVALSLLQESFDLTHNKRLCIAFAFVGMGILGVSSALTA